MNRDLASARSSRFASLRAALALLAAASISACAPTIARPPPVASAPPPLPAPTTAVAAPRPADASPSCAPPDPAAPPLAYGDVPLVALCRGLFADPATTAEDRDALRRAYLEALPDLAAFFGPLKEAPPLVVSCKTDACNLAFSGPTRRSHAIIEPVPMVIINGVHAKTKGTIVHEMVHVAIIQRMGKKARAALPTWFDEGVATFVGDNVVCAPGLPRAIDDLRRLDEPFAWVGFTNMTGKMRPAYCQARDEIGAWVKLHGRPALLEVIDAVAAGRPFDELYGPVLTAIPPAAYDRSLEARFALDEDKGTDAVDKTGRAHVGSLMSGAIWTTGRHGAGVKVHGGSYLRADGFAELGVPDSPFSITLWVKPLAASKVLVHAAMNASGGDGWCHPLLGDDASGHLVAMVNFAPNPKAFLAATGPVLPSNAWSHVAMTWSAADGVRLYVNGKIAASAAPQSAAERHRLVPAAPLYLFFGSDHGARCWTHTIEPGDSDGALDELHVFDYALTPDQVTGDMRAP